MGRLVAHGAWAGLETAHLGVGGCFVFHTSLTARLAFYVKNWGGFSF
jgi:hypothetical protein